MKKIISIWLATILAAFCGIQSFALELNEAEKTGSFDVEMNTSSHYSVVIPKYINSVSKKERGSKTEEIIAKDVLLGSYERLRIICDYSGVLTDERSSLNTIGYKIMAGDEEIKSGSCILTVKSGYVSEEFSKEFEAVFNEDILYSGQYRDTATFSVEVVSDKIKFNETEEITCKEIEKNLTIDSFVNPVTFIKKCDETCQSGGTLEKITVNEDDYSPAYIKYASSEFSETELSEFKEKYPEFESITQEKTKETYLSSFKKGEEAYKASFEDACYEILDWCGTKEIMQLHDTDENAFSEKYCEMLYSTAMKYGLISYTVSS